MTAKQPRAKHLRFDPHTKFRLYRQHFTHGGQPKRAYADETTARAAANRIVERFGHRPDSYQCGCGNWHHGRKHDRPNLDIVGQHELGLRVLVARANENNRPRIHFAQLAATHRRITNNRTPTYTSDSRPPLLGHHLAFGGNNTRMIDTPTGPRRTTTRNVCCTQCRRRWPGVGFVLTHCTKGRTP